MTDETHELDNAPASGPVWSLMLISQVGMVSLFQGLTREDVHQIISRLPGYLPPSFWTEKYLQHLARVAVLPEEEQLPLRARLGKKRQLRPSDILYADYWSPDGDDLGIDPYPKPADWDQRLADAIEALRRARGESA